MARRRRRVDLSDIRLRHVVWVAVLAGMFRVTEPFAAWPRIRLSVMVVGWLLVCVGLRWWLLAKLVRFLHRFLANPGRFRQWLFGWLKFRKSIHFTKNVKANLTQNGLSSTSGRDGILTTNSVRGTRANVPGSFYVQRSRPAAHRAQPRVRAEPKPRPGDIVRAPRVRWIRTDQFLLDWEGKLELDPVTMEPFPIDVIRPEDQVRHCHGYVVARYPKPASEKTHRRSGYLFMVEGGIGDGGGEEEAGAEFKSWFDAWQACSGYSPEQLLIDNMQRQNGMRRDG